MNICYSPKDSFADKYIWFLQHEPVSTVLDFCISWTSKTCGSDELQHTSYCS